MQGDGEQIARLEDSGNPCYSQMAVTSKTNLSIQIKGGGGSLNLNKNLKANSVSSGIVLDWTVVNSGQKKRREGKFYRKRLIREQGVSDEPSVKVHSDDVKDEGAHGDLITLTSVKGVQHVKDEGRKRRRRHQRKIDKVVQDDRSLDVCPKDNEKADAPQLKRRKRKKHKRKCNGEVVDEASRLQRRARYLLVKMKLEQNLIDAYSAEGWKGQSREKIRPEKELQRAKKQILKSKLGIRDIVHQLHILSSVGQIEESLIALDGSVHHDHIYCARCKLQDVSVDNDIILCDGTCNCAYHQKCLDPPLATENIPPEEQGWLCRYCECKMEILEALNAHLGTEFSMNNSWKDIFKEEASLPDSDTGVLNPEEEWPDDDSEDNDYNPDSDENNGSRSMIGDEDSDDGSRSSSSCCSLDDAIFLESGSPPLQSRTFECSSFIDSNVDQDSDEQTNHEIINGLRKRDTVDYKKLYDEMFGKEMANSEQLSEDEDWGPPGKRRRKKESDAANTLMALCDSEKNHSDCTLPVGKELPQISRPRKIRIPAKAVEKLRKVFAENELPTRAVKQKISQQLGIEYEKVNKWFKNSRYAAHKTRKCVGELDDDVSLKQLLQLKTKSSKKKKIVFSKDPHVREAEVQMETVCQIEAKLQKLRHILMEIQAVGNGEQDGPCVIYIPVAELKEKERTVF